MGVPKKTIGFFWVRTRVSEPCILRVMSFADRGLVSISIMKRLEELSRRRISDLFDYVCGVSTGSLIGAMATIYRVPIAEMEEIYKEFSVQMFEQNRFVGAGKLITSHAYYDTELWETILKYFLLSFRHRKIVTVAPYMAE